MKQFIKSDNEWVFSREYIEFQDGGPLLMDLKMETMHLLVMV